MTSRQATPESLNRRHQQPPSTSSTPCKKPSPNVGEVAGGTAANIFVVCCCCPCGLLECLILSAYKLPVSIIRRIRRKREAKSIAKRSSKNGLLEQRGGSNCGNGDELAVGREYDDVETDCFEKMKKVSVDGEDEEFDRRMWDQFHDTGFWRTCSQRHITTNNATV